VGVTGEVLLEEVEQTPLLLENTEQPERTLLPRRRRWHGELRGNAHLVARQARRREECGHERTREQPRQARRPRNRLRGQQTRDDEIVAGRERRRGCEREDRAT